MLYYISSTKWTATLVRSFLLCNKTLQDSKSTHNFPSCGMHYLAKAFFFIVHEMNMHMVHGNTIIFTRFSCQSVDARNESDEVDAHIHTLKLRQTQYGSRQIIRKTIKNILKENTSSGFESHHTRNSQAFTLN